MDLRDLSPRNDVKGGSPRSPSSGIPVREYEEQVLTPQKLQNGINTNTYVSVGLLIVLIGGFGAVLNTIYATRSEITGKQDRFDLKLEQLDKRVDKFEKYQESWSFQDMFKWVVHLQRDNPTIKVPEPESKANP